MLAFDHAVNVYPWDVLDDPGAADAIASLGVPAASLTSNYHTVRALTPGNPRRAVVHASHAAAYFEPHPSRYDGLRLRPLRPAWIEDDAYRTGQTRLRAAGLRVHAWTVLLHATVHGTAHPDLTVENAFGDRYPFALCPAHPEVRAYATALVADVTRTLRPDAVELEAWGYLGFTHGSHHDKVGVALDPFHEHLLSLCFNPASQDAIARAGGHPTRIREHVRHALRAFLGGDTPADPDPSNVAARLDELLGHTDAMALTMARESVTVALLDDLLAAMPADRPTVYAHAMPSPYDTGSSVGIRPELLQGRVDGAILPLFGRTPADAAHLISQFVAAGGDVPAIATVPLLEGPTTASRAAVIELANSAVDAGATGLRYYHWGLAPPARHAWIAELVAGATRRSGAAHRSEGGR